MFSSTLGSPVWRRRNVLNASMARLALGVFLIWLIISGQGLVGYFTKGSRIGPELLAREAADVVVVLGFDPERFHNEQLGRYGVFSGRDGDVRRVRLRNVSQARLHELSELVWISSIEPMP